MRWIVVLGNLIIHLTVHCFCRQGITILRKYKCYFSTNITTIHKPPNIFKHVYVSMCAYCVGAHGVCNDITINENTLKYRNTK